MHYSLDIKLPLASLPTPLQPLDRISEVIGGPRIWIKRDDLTHFGASGNKIRKLEYVLAQGIHSDRANVIITCGGLQSNHCRATALLCAQLGVKCHLILRGDEPECLDGNTLLAHLAGAAITFLPAAQYREHFEDVLSEVIGDYTRRGDIAYFVPTGASDEVGLWGYYAAARELVDDIETHNLNVKTVCCATGSGGTHAGLSLGLHHLNFEGGALGFAVCDDSRYFIRKGQEDIGKWYARYFPNVPTNLPNIEVNDDFIGEGYGVAGVDVFNLIKKLASLEGILLDPVYTGKAFLGMVTLMAQGFFSGQKDLVFLHTGGGFGLFPYRDQLSC